MSQRERVTIAIHASDRAFAPGVQTALMRLGYNLISARTARRQHEQGILTPEVRIIEKRHLGKLDGTTDLPMILVRGAREQIEDDGSLLGIVRKRARLADLYSLLQHHLEELPRSVPRVLETLPARATRGAESWTGAIRSLSEKGCLLQSTAPMRSDTRVEICFPLASKGLVQLPAELSYQSPEGIGLVFGDLPEETREAISDYVTSRLVA